MMKTYATELEARAAAAAKSAEMMETWETVDFEGQNCEDTNEPSTVCDGWDGNSRRCECGNRRVAWDFAEYPKGVWTYYAAAY